MRLSQFVVSTARLVLNVVQSIDHFLFESTNFMMAAHGSPYPSQDLIHQNQMPGSDLYVKSGKGEDGIPSLSSPKKSSTHHQDRIKKSNKNQSR